MKFSEYLKKNPVYLDGAMGTLLQKAGLKPGELPERWNLTHPEKIVSVHRAYFDAGSNVVCTNTFGANRLKFDHDELEKIVFAAVENAKKARAESVTPQEKFIALDIGPSGKLLKPLGDMEFEDAVSLFGEVAKLGERFGADLILIETMNDSLETKAALLGAKENSSLPVLVSNAYGEDGKLMTGATPSAMVAMLEGMGADAIGANCSLGPKQLRGVMEEILCHASVPVLMKPNAGLPHGEGDETSFDVGPEEFAREIAPLMERGLGIAGGCCGTTPKYIEKLVEVTKGIVFQPPKKKFETVISSYSHAVFFGNEPILIGERINPTGKKRLRQALVEKDTPYLLNLAISQQEKGAHVLDVNVGLPEINEGEMLLNTVLSLQTVTDLPLQIDTADPVAMEGALRRYNGKAMINSVNGKEESMAAIFPLVKKYGGLVVALTLDENGIPETAEGRVQIAKKILSVAKEYGLEEKDLIFDPLAMTVSTDPDAVTKTLAALRAIRQDLGCHTSLGVSNISFGLPNRDAINATFFALALENGLSAAIMNPDSAEMMKTYFCYRALRGFDEGFHTYMEKAQTFSAVATVSSDPSSKSEELSPSLCYAIVKGLKEEAAVRCSALLKERSPLDIINSEIIPALNQVGQGFEEKTVYLPGLLMSAEAAKSAFDEIKHHATEKENKSKGGTVILATVQGDIHDIGKNIVKLLMENYGFSVVDLGKDVSPKAVLDAVQTHQAPLVGLSALMTTTVPAMEETIRRIREEAPFCKVMVGGAVLTAEYAEKIGADFYAKDALAGVRFAQEVIGI